MGPIRHSNRAPKPRDFQDLPIRSPQPRQRQQSAFTIYTDPPEGLSTQLSYQGLDNSLDDGLDDCLDDSLDDGLDGSLYEYSGSDLGSELSEEGLDKGLDGCLDGGLDEGLDEGLDRGLDEDPSAQLFNSLNEFLSTWFSINPLYQP